MTVKLVAPLAMALTAASCTGAADTKNTFDPVRDSEFLAQCHGAVYNVEMSESIPMPADLRGRIGRALPEKARIVRYSYTSAEKVGPRHFFNRSANHGATLGGNDLDEAWLPDRRRYAIVRDNLDIVEKCRLVMDRWEANAADRSAKPVSQL